MHHWSDAVTSAAAFIGIAIALMRVDGELTVRAGHEIAHAVKDVLLASTVHRISDVTVHVEPVE